MEVLRGAERVMLNGLQNSSGWYSHSQNPAPWTTAGGNSNSYNAIWRMKADGSWEVIDGNSYTWPYTPSPYNPYVPPTSYYPTPPQGWECPKCHRANAPTNLQCQCSYGLKFNQCAVCGTNDNLRRHGIKHICERCVLSLIDEAIKAVRQEPE